jgi:ribosomal protein L7/L12
MLQHTITIELYNATEQELSYVGDLIEARRKDFSNKNNTDLKEQENKLRIKIISFGCDTSGKINAIKWLRDQCNCSLASAKHLVDAVLIYRDTLPNLVSVNGNTINIYDFINL